MLKPPVAESVFQGVASLSSPCPSFHVSGASDQGAPAHNLFRSEDIFDGNLIIDHLFLKRLMEDSHLFGL